jgi:hypothetical protein
MKRFYFCLLLLAMWILLTGSKGGCWSSESVCDDLAEEECIDNPDCRPVYTGTYWKTADGAELDYAPEAPVFDYCEEKPVCEELDEEECLSEPVCQTIYGYPLGPAEYRCGGDRCPPTEEFIECLEAGVDPCIDLSEEECVRRPICEAVYPIYDTCRDGSDIPESDYQGCRLRDLDF